jgi:CRP-like cAMP-binding protein
MSQLDSDLQPFLDRLTRRSVLTPQEQQAILDLPRHAQQVRANRDFVRLGERVHHSCFVADGIVGGFGQNANGARQITAFFLPGDMADLRSVVQPTPTTALQALSVATILKIPHAAIRKVAARYPAVAAAFWRDCMVDSSVLAQWLVNIGRRDARARIAHVLCEAAVRFKAAPAKGDVVFPFAVTQLQMADATGLTPVHVNRTIMALRKQDLVTFRGHTVWIHDWDVLTQAADFDPEYLLMDVKPEQWVRTAEDCRTR